MPQLVRDETGQLHKFPDEATPEMIAKALGASYETPENIKSNKIDQIKYLTGSNRTPVDSLRDLAGGVVSGLMKGGELGNDIILKFPGAKRLAGSIHDKFFPKINITNDEVNNMFDKIKSPNRSLWGDLTYFGGEIAPYAFAGGRSLLGTMLAGAGAGAAFTNPNDKVLLNKISGLGNVIPSGRIGGAIEGALTPLAIGKALSLGGKVISKIPGVSSKLQELIENESLKTPPAYKTSSEATFGTPEGSQFTNIPFENPIPMVESGENINPATSLSVSEKNINRNQSDNLAKTIFGHISQNKNIEETGKELASHLKSGFEKNILSKANKKYNLLFSHPEISGKSIYEGSRNPIYGIPKVGQYESLNIHYPKGSDLSKLHTIFIREPTLENLHNLQSELGGEIGHLNRLDAKNELSPSDRVALSRYRMARTSLFNDANKYLSNKPKELQNAYKSATEYWNQNVIPYYQEKLIRDIVKGKIVNPTRSEVISTFKNPEPSMDKIIDEMGPDFKRKILHLSLGKPLNTTSNDILKSLQSLENKGLSSYIDNHYKQGISNIRDLRALEENDHISKLIEQKKLKALEKRNTSISEQLKSAQEKSNRLRVSKAKERQKNYQNAQKEANQNVEQFKVQQEKIRNEIEQAKIKQKEFKKQLLLGALGGITLEELGRYLFKRL